jgi:hypothetical protein
VKSFEEIYQSRLREHIIPLTIGKGPIGQGVIGSVIANSETGEPIENWILSSLRKIQGKPNWEQANLATDSTALDVTEEYAMDAKNDDLSFLICAKASDDYEGQFSEPVGVVKFVTGCDASKNVLDHFGIDPEENYELISEVYLVGFKENNFTLVKDMFLIVDNLLKEFDIIMWSVKDDNPIKKAYDRILSRFKNVYRNGSDRYSGDAYTQYALSSR